MVEKLDEVDVKLIDALEHDADRSNVELARLIGLSPAATLHRVRRLKETGIIRAIQARVDAEKAGFPLRVFVLLEVGRHDEAAHNRLERAVKEIPQVIRAEWVAGENDALLEIVARTITELQQVQLKLSAKGGALRVTTLLRMSELKPPSPLPLAFEAS